MVCAQMCTLLSSVVNKNFMIITLLQIRDLLMTTVLCGMISGISGISDFSFCCSLTIGVRMRSEGYGIWSVRLCVCLTLILELQATKRHANGTLIFSATTA